MKQYSNSTPLTFNRLGRAALIALPILVARTEAAPKTHSPSAKTTVRAAKSVAFSRPEPIAVRVKTAAEAVSDTRGAVFNREPGQTVRLDLSGTFQVNVAEGAEFVRTQTQNGVLSIEAIKVGQALVVVEREGAAPQNYVVRVRAVAASVPPAEAVSAPALSVETKAAAQIADLTVPAEAAPASEMAVPVTPTAVVPAAAPGAEPMLPTADVTAPSALAVDATPVTVTPATAMYPAAPDVTRDVTVATGSTSGTTTNTRSVTTPVAVASGNLTTGTGRQFDTVRVSPPLPAPSRLPSGRALYPTTPNIPQRVRTATKTTPRNAIAVTQGLARLLQFNKNILSVFFSDINVMDARAVNARTVAITGLAPGVSTLAVFSERYPGDAIGQPVIYQISVSAPSGVKPPPLVTPNIESIETAIRTAIDDPRVSVSVIQSPGGVLTARLTGAVRDAVEADAARATAALFVPQVVSALYVDKEAQTMGQARLPGETAQLQEMLRRVTDNSSIEFIPAPGGGSILKATVASLDEADALMRLVPLQQRVTPFIVIRGAGKNSPAVYPTVRPTLNAEDAEMTERLQAITNVRTVYVTRTAQNGLAVYGTVRDRAQFDAVRRYARILPQVKTGTGDRQDNIPANFPAGGGTFPLGVQMFVTILDGSQSVLRKVTVQTNVVEINRTALRNLGVEFGSAALLTETATPGQITRTVDPTFLPGTGLAGNGFLGSGGFGAIDPFRARLNALYTRGNARILSAPNVTALNGTEAQITVGGSRPIPSSVASSGGVGTAVEFRRYGIIMTMRPTVTDDDTILMQIRADVTNIDPTTAIQLGSALIPGETVRSVNTTLNVREGDIIVMGGLITNEQLKRTSKVPILSEIPILGSLFQSKRFENNETELAIFMTPSITRTPASDETLAAEFNASALPPLSTNQDGGSSATLVNAPSGR